MPEIVLSTLNARYAHASFGLRYLLANLGELATRAAMLEFDINQRTSDVLEKILAQSPRIVGLGVYIWNVDAATRLVADLRRLAPDMVIILGGPEVSYETDQQEICRLADYVICGEADLAFAQLCGQILSGRRPLMKVITAALPEFSQLQLPYDFYNGQDLAHRVVYVEASRGCPFKCEFCLSSLDVPVRNVPLEAFLEAMGRLLDRGLRQFKFVDRTFNLNLNISRGILEFFLSRYEPGLFLHFEMIPDRLPAPLRDLIVKFPPGALQFEVGVQTLNEQVSQRISRRQDNVKLADNLRFLREQTGVHVHADLIVGLPGEDLASFAAGFDRLVDMSPQEIQVGMLKRLRGTPIVRHDAEWGMIYSPAAPYEILRTAAIDFATMQRLRRFSRYWDLIANSGNFRDTAPLIWRGSSPFQRFMQLSDRLWQRLGRDHAIALPTLAFEVFQFLIEQRSAADCTAEPLDRTEIATTMSRDYQRGGRRDLDFLREAIGGGSASAKIAATAAVSAAPAPRRQARHLSGG